MKLKGRQQANVEEIHKAYGESEVGGLSEHPCRGFNDKSSLGFPFAGCDRRDVYCAKLDINLDEQIDEPEFRTIGLECQNTERDISSSDSPAGATWDVFRREDIPKLAEYLRVHWIEFGKSDVVLNDHVSTLLLSIQCYFVLILVGHSISWNFRSCSLFMTRQCISTGATRKS